MKKERVSVSESQTPTLDSLARDLTELARQEQLDPELDGRRG